MMEGVNKIKDHPLFLQHMAQNTAAEADRQFCKHDLTHALDVARIAYILNLESQERLPKEQIYAAALLHDITKWQEHADGTPHNVSAIEAATQILSDCGFSDGEIAAVCNAIFQHRSLSEGAAPLARLLFHADKKSRACYACTLSDACKWTDMQKNQSLSY